MVDYNLDESKNREQMISELEDWYSVRLFEMTDEQIRNEYADKIEG